MNITLIGMPGSGKSFIGKKLSEVLGYQLIELDALMEERLNMSVQRALETLGEKAFLEEQAKDAIAHTKDLENIVISPGGSLVYSDAAMEHLKTISKIAYLKTDLETIATRINETPRGIVGLNNTTLEALYNERTPLYEKWADHTIDAERDIAAVLEDIMALL